LPSELATTEEFVEVIDRILPGAGERITVDGPTIPANIPPKPHFIAELFSDWRATTLEEGIRRIVQFYQREPAAVLES
jgi:hypothetical protein